MPELGASILFELSMSTIAPGLSGTLLPLHLKLKPDELLSSWLARIAIAHCLKPYTLGCLISPKNNLWVADLDRCANESTISVLSARTGTPPERIVSATLASYEGQLNEKYSQKGPLRWALPIRKPRYLGTTFGLQFCPSCLAEDKEPYFRLSWRLAFVTLCPRHRLQLLDRCPKCEEPVDCYKNASQFDEDSLNPLTICSRCKFDLRQARGTPYRIRVGRPEIDFQSFLLAGLQQGWVQLPRCGPMYSHLFFAGLYQIASILSAGPKAKSIREAVAQRHKITTVSFTLLQKSMPALYKYNPAERRILLRMACCLLTDWPNGFLQFSHENELWSEVWLRRMAYVPYWYWKVVHENLERTQYLMSEPEFWSAVDYVRQLGVTVNRRNVSEYVGRTAYIYFRRRSWADGPNPRSTCVRECPRCHVIGNQAKAGLSRSGNQTYKCTACGRKYTEGKKLRFRTTKEVRSEGIRLHREGKDIEEIARVLSVPIRNVSGWVES